jgi:hypothetical protein
VAGVQVDVLAGAGEPLDAVLEQDGAPGVEAVGGDGVGFDDDGGSCRAQVADEPVPVMPYPSNKSFLVASSPSGGPEGKEA